MTIVMNVTARNYYYSVFTYSFNFYFLIQVIKVVARRCGFHGVVVHRLGQS